MSKALTSLESKGNLLEDIAWSRDVEERFFAAKCGQLPEPEYAIDHDALEDESARLERWSTLLPYFAFTSFMDEVTLRPVEEHYQHLIALAGSVRR